MGSKAFFLDRDGVINEGHSLNRPDELRLIKGVPDAIRQLNKLEYEVFVVTNQGGVGLGHMKKEQLDTIHQKMIEIIRNDGGVIRDIRACIHKPKEGCDCRKPKPGMISELAIEMEHSFMVGDRDVDIEAGKSAGLKTIFIGDRLKAPFVPKPDFVYPDLLAAVESLAEQNLI
jgi:D-glycero-D-manno-heptose 1,7-bisphosphate phosphatase